MNIAQLALTALGAGTVAWAAYEIIMTPRRDDFHVACDDPEMHPCPTCNGPCKEFPNANGTETPR